MEEQEINEQRKKYKNNGYYIHTVIIITSFL